MATVYPRPLTEFPNEMLAEIASYLVSDSSSLAALAQCASIWVPIVVPLLYSSTNAKALRTLATNETLLQSFSCPHPAVSVTSLYIDADVEAALVHRNLRQAIFNIQSRTTTNILQRFAYISQTSTLPGTLWTSPFPSLLVRDIVLNCPMGNENNGTDICFLLSHVTRSITFDWSGVTTPPTYQEMTDLFLVLPMLVFTQGEVCLAKT
ncbi:hypothetical protein GG344DRAFT_84694 [Lentinula edodes]|nr:hypothetical protein GG344DRAFT_84694 [Lentinula edodes]